MTHRRCEILFVRLCLLSAFGCITGTTLTAADNAWLDIARASITTHELSEYADYLAGDMLEGREAGKRGGHAAAKYLLSNLKELGVQGAAADGGMVQPFPSNLQNILIQFPGSDPKLKEEVVLISAHYDHVGYGNRTNSYGPFGYIHNGADDNASGVSVLLEVVDALSRTGHQFRRTVLFAFWDGEEDGLLGSAYWARNPTVALEHVKLNINADMVGRLKDGKIEVGGTRCACGLRRLMCSDSLQNAWIDFSWEYKENSDHWTFFQRNIPALYIHTGMHGDYHRPSDDIEKLNLEGMQQIARYLLERISTLADVDELPAFRPQARQEKDYARRRMEKVLPPLPSRLPFDVVPLSTEPSKLVVSRCHTLPSELQPGDRIVAVEGNSSVDESLLKGLALRSSENLELQIERRNADELITVNVPLKGSPTRLGISWREDPAEPGAVFVSRVVPYSPAERAGFHLHDRIYAVDNTPFQDRHELLEMIEAKLNSSARGLDFLVETRGVMQHLHVPLSEEDVHAVDSSL